MAVDRIANPLRTAGHRASAVAPGLITRLWLTAVVAIERRQARKLVGQMDDRMLRDIGIHRGDTERAIRQGRDHGVPVQPWWGQ